MEHLLSVGGITTPAKGSTGHARSMLFTLMRRTEQTFPVLANPATSFTTQEVGWGRFFWHCNQARVQ